MRSRVLWILFATVSALVGPLLAGARAQAPWYDDAWTHRVPLSVASASLPADTTLTDFPLLLDAGVLAPAMARARSDGGDLVCTTGDGRTVLPLEIVHFDAAGPAAEVWVRADTLRTDRRQFYLYYGNPAAAAPTAPVWNADYVAVYHFEEDPGSGVLADYTAAGNDARADQPNSNWTSGDVAPGQIGQGWQFNGTSHYINTDKVRTQDASYTISAWLKHTTRSTDFMFQSNPGFWQLASQASDTSHHVQFKDGTVEVRFQPGEIPLDEFHHFAWVFHADRHQVEFFFDGVSRDTIFFWPPETDPQNYYTGYLINPDGSDLVGILGPMFHNPLDLMTGVGDEFRVSEAELPAAWLATEVANQIDPSAFFAVGPEETSDSVPRTSVSELKGSFWTPSP